MPFSSKETHRMVYVESSATTQRLDDIKVLITGILRLQIALPLKKRMLVHSIWEVAQATGNFCGRYRSEGVINSIGLKIQRDHIFKKRVLVEDLLKPSPNIDLVIERARCCVVTLDEHKRLHRVGAHLDGWDRYREAEVLIYDMVDRTQLI